MDYTETGKLRMTRRAAARRTRWILLIFTTAILTYAVIRVKVARQYMETQIERLERDGKGIYMVQGYEFFKYSSYTGPAITVRARAPESHRFPDGDEFHYIEIDYPWIPFLFRPTHRI